MRRWPTDRSSNHTVEWHAGINEPLGHTGTGSDGPILIGVANQLRIQGEPTPTGLFDDAAQTQLRVAFYGIQQCIFVVNVTGTDHCKSGGTAVIQVACGHGGCGYIVWGHVIHNAPRVRAPTMTSGKSTFRSSGEMFSTSLMERIMPSDTVELNFFSRSRAPFAEPSAYVVTYTGIVALTGGLDGAVGELGQIWRNQRRHGEGDEAGVIAVEVAGGHVDSVVEVLNDRLDLARVSSVIRRSH